MHVSQKYLYYNIKKENPWLESSETLIKFYRQEFSKILNVFRFNQI
jgi:hypothetical protein